MEPDKATEAERTEDRAAERKEDSEDQAQADAVGDHDTILKCFWVAFRRWCNQRTAILGECHWGYEFISTQRSWRRESEWDILRRRVVKE